MVAPATVSLAPSADGTRDVGSASVKNTGVHAGVADVFSWGLRSGPVGAGSVDVRAVGVQSLTTGLDGTPLPDSDRMLVFAINTYEPWSSAATGEFDILINKDASGTDWYVLSAVDHGLATTGQPDGRMGCFLFRGSDEQLVAAAFADAPDNSSTLRCGVLASALALSAGAQPIAYTVQSVSLVSAEADAIAGIGYLDPFAPAISQGDRVSLGPGRSATVPLWVDPVAFANQPALGWMIVSPDDPSGPAQAETIPLVLPPASP